jgi:hypothetical protein
MNNYHLTKIKQIFPDNRILNLKEEVRKELLKLNDSIKPGNRIAIAAGSRGINNLALVVKEVAEFIRGKNAFPFIVPAMGSHGDATATGQAEILESYGITEKLIGVPVISSMDVVELPFSDSPVQVFMDKNAYNSDGVILVNRIKPHTDFHGTYESGLVKMSVIGLGKERQASVIHSFGVFGLTDLLPEIAKKVLSAGRILGGIGLVENAYDETMVVKALKPDEFFDQEPVLLATARKNMPSLPIKDIDILIIDRLGKDISGTGIDPNIIGRMRIMGQKEPENPKIKAIIVTDLTEATHGNAIGIGLSDVITRTLYDKIDFSSTYINAVTSSFIERAKIPIIAKNEREAFAIALRSCGYLKSGEEKIVRIKDTLHLGEVYVSRAVLDSITNGNGIIINDVQLFNYQDEFQPF